MRYSILALLTVSIFLAGCGSADPQATTNTAAGGSGSGSPEIGSEQWLNDAEKAQASRDRQFAENTLRPGESKRIGDYEIRFQSVEFREVETVDDSGQPTETVGPCLVLTTQFVNHSADQVAVPVTTPFKAEDNLENDLEMMLGYDRHAKGDEAKKKVSPGEEATLIVCLKRKSAEAETYTARMRTSYDPKSSDSVLWTAEFDAPAAEAAPTESPAAEATPAATPAVDTPPAEAPAGRSSARGQLTAQVRRPKVGC
jgi:hypothetical protein